MMSEIHLDLHTHSIISYDGGIKADQYRDLLQKNPSLCIAISDHNEISLALELNKEFPNRIIVAEEIMTQEGEITGLFLTKKIESKLSAAEAILQIKSQGGLVYIPHPLEKSRKGLQMTSLKNILGSVDIIEVFNARAKEPWLQKQVKQFATEQGIAMASSSDAHGQGGIGTAYSVIENWPTKETLVDLLRRGSLVEAPAPVLSFLDPLFNKIKKKLL